MACKCKVVDGTHYHQSTPDAVIKVLEHSRTTRTRIRLIYGDVGTGYVWDEGIPERGHVGRSMGACKIPLLIKTARSYGGEGILDHCIVEIRESKGGRVLYKKN